MNALDNLTEVFGGIALFPHLPHAPLAGALLVALGLVLLEWCRRRST